MAFKLKSGNTTAFKQMGSSPAKQGFGPTPKTEEPPLHPSGIPDDPTKGMTPAEHEQWMREQEQNRQDHDQGKGLLPLPKNTDPKKKTPAKQRVDPLDLGLLDEAKKVKVNMGLPKNFNTSGKDKWVKRSKELLKKSGTKGSKFLSGKTLGLLGMLMSNDAYSKTDQPEHHKPKAKPLFSEEEVRAISKSLPNATSKLMKKIKQK